MHKNYLLLFACIAGIYFLSCTKGVVSEGSDNDDDDDEAGKEVIEDDKKDDNVDGKTLTVKYEADNSIFPNPERGLYTHRGYENDAKPITANDLKKIRGDNITLVFMNYYLKDFINKPISDQMLKLIQDNFDALRATGLKAVLRFAYSKSSEASVLDADRAIALNHIAQLKPLFEKNMDVIAVMEAGFIGAWGEWYYSTYYGNRGNPDYDKRRIILNALLEAMPKERMISLRTPLLKTKMLDISYNEPLTEKDAYDKSYKARLSHHNDCFLADASDMGTYNSESARAYTAADSRYTCVGGETCTEPTTYSECTAAIAAMTTNHWSYINIDYHKGILNEWQQRGCFEEIQKRLGYRFVLTQANHPETISPGGSYELTLTIYNEGFAAPYNPRKAEIRFRSTTSGEIAYTYTMTADPRFWFSGSHEVKEKIKMPTGMKTGEYEVVLFMPDPTESLRERPEYAIRLANKGIWEEKTGYNKLFNQKVE
jgi:hypothetical protein